MTNPQAGAAGARGAAPPPIDFEAVFDASPNPYMLLDRELRYVAANAAYLRVTAARLDDLLGRAVLEVFPNDPVEPNNPSATTLRRSLERVLQTGQPDVLPLLAYRVSAVPGGPLQDRYWSATHTPLLDKRGEVAFVLQHAVDVTEMHRMAAAAARDEGHTSDPPTPEGAGVLGRAQLATERVASLTEELRRLRAMFEQAPGFMCMLRGPDHVFEVANAAYFQLVGHRDILGKTVRAALPEVEAQGYIDLLDRVRDTREAFVGHGLRAMLQRTPGAPPEERFLNLVYQPIADPSGEVVGIFVQGNDITEQKRAELEQRFLAESIPQQVWTSGPDGRLDFVNERVVRYFDAPREHILGAGWQGVIHPDDLASCLARWQRSLDTGEPYEVEFRLRRGDGAYRWHLARAVALRDPSGTVRKWFGTNTDVDDANKVRDELRARSESEQQLIGIVSHDLRNPLNAIGLAAATLLHARAPDAPDRKILTRMVAATERAGRLISDFLDFAQSRAVDIPIHPRPANLPALIGQVVDEARLSDSSRPVRVVHHGAETGRWDSDRLTQVLGNLIGNAFQHGPPDAPVSVVSRVEGDEVQIDVHNDGPPIAPGDMGLLFEPFRRGAHARASHGRSVGLGLYIARQVVVAHGGTLTVASAPGEGTRFTVRMPREVKVPGA